MKNPPQLIDFDKNANYRVGEKGEERKKTEKARQRKNRAKEKLDAGEYEDALERFTGVIELRPDWTDAYLYRGYFKEHKSQYGNAIVDFDKAIQLKPDLVTAYIARGDVRHMYLDQHEDAIPDYDVAIRLTPDERSIYFQRGKAEIEMAQYQAAISDIDRFIGFNPNSAQTYFYRGVAKFNLNCRKEAKQDFITAWHLTPENAIRFRKKMIVTCLIMMVTYLCITIFELYHSITQIED